MEKSWANLSWKEKREERFKRWLSPQNIKFVSPEAETLYKQRVTRFIKAIKIEEPDRVPVVLPTGNFPAYYAGTDLHTIMYDYGEMRRAWLKFMNDFGDMDAFNPTLSPSGRINEALNSKVSVWPGHGLPLNASMNQTVEGEYMKADEYDLMLMDPSDYHFRVNLPELLEFLSPSRNCPLCIRFRAQAGLLL